MPVLSNTHFVKHNNYTLNWMKETDVCVFLSTKDNTGTMCYILNMQIRTSNIKDIPPAKNTNCYINDSLIKKGLEIIINRYSVPYTPDQ
jgi:hypothetical protein